MGRPSPSIYRNVVFHESLAAFVLTIHMPSKENIRKQLVKQNDYKGVLTGSKFNKVTVRRSNVSNDSQQIIIIGSSLWNEFFRGASSLPSHFSSISVSYFSDPRNTTLCANNQVIITHPSSNEI